MHHRRAQHTKIQNCLSDESGLDSFWKNLVELVKVGKGAERPVRIGFLSKNQYGRVVTFSMGS